ncbi:DUF5668 domain-containing protein [Pedobacter sp. P351]|uniref:LiaF transmembrane domain-containing protein n=1 Tax=Pedobacter superstes TaxID=3133441 RepID=UPI00309A8947
MRTEKIIWGIILVFIGGVLLLQNFGVIDFYWQVIFKFWPVALILIGANLLFSRDNSRTGAIISVLLTLIVLGFITYKGLTSDDNDSRWTFNKDGTDSHDESVTNTFIEEYNDSIGKAVLNIKGGATRYILKDTTSNLFEADVKKNFGNYSLFRTIDDSAHVLNFKMNGKSNWHSKDNDGNKATIKLNSNPVWDINLEMGAGLANLDLSPFKINSLSIKGGAASFKIKLAEPVKTTTVSVETGVSEIEVFVPRTAACKITTESGLSSNDFNGFTKQADGSYITNNYDDSLKTIILNLRGGLSKFEVKRY